MTSSTLMALGSLLPGMGGWTSLAGSVGVSPSRAQNLCSPRTATTVLAADLTPRAVPPSEPSVRAMHETRDVMAGDLVRGMAALRPQGSGRTASGRGDRPKRVGCQPPLHAHVLKVLRDGAVDGGLGAALAWLRRPACSAGEVSATGFRRRGGGHQRWLGCAGQGASAGRSPAKPSARAAAAARIPTTAEGLCSRPARTAATASSRADPVEFDLGFLVGTFVPLVVGHVREVTGQVDPDGLAGGPG